MQKCMKVFHTRSTVIATLVGNAERFTKLERNVVYMRFYFTAPRDVSPRTAKLRRGVILNSEFHYFEEDEISTESSRLKMFLLVTLIDRFTSPFQLRQLQYSIMLQLAAAEIKKRPASTRAIEEYATSYHNLRT